MSRSMRNATIIALAFLAGACVRVGHIQQTAPVREAAFAGDHKLVAQCVQRRLGGRVQDDSFGEKYLIYDATKNRPDFTHWSVTVGRTGSGQGLAEWRVMRPVPVSGTGSPAGGGVASSSGDLPAASVREFWDPVLACIAQAKPGPRQ